MEACWGSVTGTINFISGVSIDESLIHRAHWWKVVPKAPQEKPWPPWVRTSLAKHQATAARFECQAVRALDTFWWICWSETLSQDFWTHSLRKLSLLPLQKEQMKAEQSCGIKPKILHMFFCLTWPVIRLDHLGASFPVLDVSVKYNVIKLHSSYCAQSTENTLKNVTACLQFLCPQILDPLTQKHSSTHKTLVHRHLKCVCINTN